MQRTRHRHPRGVARSPRRAFLLAAGLGFVAAASGAEPPEAAKAPPAVSLDKLLTLPSTATYNHEKKRGASEGEWRARFRDAREELENEQEELRQNEEELAKVAGAKSPWQFTAPGMSNVNVGDSPVDYQLRQKVRRGRERVRALERVMRELEVEANLAEVPEHWRN